MAFLATSFELPEQDFYEIQTRILSLKSSSDDCVDNDDLHYDPSFPPDITSLTYVYSGDDQYERMTFKRPKELCVSPTLCGVGGVCDIPVPWRMKPDRLWIQSTLAVISTSPMHMGRVIPGYQAHEQNFQQEYVGAFQFHIWRFGEWREIVVDDYLPVIDGHLAYCPVLGSPPEFWGALLEKAYAKCHKAYEAIETGNPLNTLTDLTGDVCEHYSTRDTTQLDLFHILYTSYSNRSHICCWLSRETLNLRGFLWQQQSQKGGRGSGEDYIKSLMLVTAVTKFPMVDGSLQSVIRIQDPYCNGQPLWNGDFSTKCGSSWEKVNPRFHDNFRPRACLHQYEFWISLPDFMKYYSDVVICSSSTPTEAAEYDAERIYKCAEANDFTDLVRVQEIFEDFSMLGHESTRAKKDFMCVPLDKEKTCKASHEILVQESSSTIKLDNVPDEAVHPKMNGQRASLAKDNISRANKEFAFSNGDHPVHLPLLTSLKMTSSKPSGRGSPISSVGHGSYPKRSRQSRSTGSTLSGSLGCVSSTSSAALSRVGGSDDTCETDISVSLASSRQSGLSDAVSSGSLTSSGGALRESNFCIDVQKGNSFQLTASRSFNGMNSNYKKRSEAYQTPSYFGPSPSLHSPMHRASDTTCIFESRMDYFRATGGWKELLLHYGKWRRSTAGGPRTNIESHSKNPRCVLVLGRPDARNELTLQSCQGKAHIIITLMQDYRLGGSKVNSLLIPIGFSLYKMRNSDRDEKKNLSKLVLIDDTNSQSECREVVKRYDLDPGMYLIVPYTLKPGKEGEFLIRVLGQRDEVANKSSCVIA